MIKIFIFNRFFLIFVFYFVGSLFNISFSEYRAYQYLVSQNSYTSNQEQFIIISTLDPPSFLSYHGGPSSLKITLLYTWICKGHTGHFSPTCHSPFRKIKEVIDRPSREDPNILP